MKVEPRDLDRDALVSTLRTWELTVTSLSYLPVGASSHHYLALDSAGRRWFVTVDELLSKLFALMGPTLRPWVEIDLDAAYEALDRAFRTAVALREAGLEFVHAPITRPDGQVLARLGDYAVSVLPFIDGISDKAGVRQPPDWHIAWRGEDTRRRLLEMVGRLHAATDAVASGLPQRDTLTVPLRPGFLDALDDLQSPWTAGPYGEPARRLLQEQEGAIRDVFGRCDELADAVRATSRPWVVTHGAIHDDNVVRTQDGVLLLVDWDYAAVGPRERDLATWANDLEPRTDDDWAAYTAAGQPRGLDPVVVELYRHIQDLWGVCEYTAAFRLPHVDNADTRQQWTVFQHQVAEVCRRSVGQP